MNKKGRISGSEEEEEKDTGGRDTQRNSLGAIST